MHSRGQINSDVSKNNVIANSLKLVGLSYTPSRGVSNIGAAKTLMYLKGSSRETGQYLPRLKRGHSRLNPSKKKRGLSVLLELRKISTEMQVKKKRDLKC
jgi:hypothetical protein